MRKPLGILTIVIGIISGILFFKGGFALSAEGTELTNLRSVGGNTVAEEYYQTMGKYGIAYANVSYALGLGVIALSLGLGGNLLSKENDQLALQSELTQSAGLRSCPNCNNPCSTEATSCPKCGTVL